MVAKLNVGKLFLNDFFSRSESTPPRFRRLKTGVAKAVNSEAFPRRVPCYRIQIIHWTRTLDAVGIRGRVETSDIFVYLWLIVLFPVVPGAWPLQSSSSGGFVLLYGLRNVRQPAVRRTGAEARRRVAGGRNESADKTIRATGWWWPGIRVRREQGQQLDSCFYWETPDVRMVVN